MQSMAFGNFAGQGRRCTIGSQRRRPDILNGSTRSAFRLAGDDVSGRTAGAGDHSAMPFARSRRLAGLLRRTAGPRTLRTDVLPWQLVSRLHPEAEAIGSWP